MKAGPTRFQVFTKDGAPVSDKFPVWGSAHAALVDLAGPGWSPKDNSCPFVVKRLGFSAGMVNQTLKQKGAE